MSAFSKELFRAIALKPGRFLALLAIVALGAGFYAGLRTTAPDMKLALDAYLDGAFVYDVRVVSTMGLDQADIDALSELEGVEAAMGARQADVLSNIAGTTYTTRVHSLPGGARESLADSEGGATVLDGEGASADGAYLNRLELVEGRWPQEAGECLVSADRVLSQGIELGQELSFMQGTARLRDTFTTLKYTVVGKVHMPYYVSSAAIDSSSLGSGVVQQVLYVAPESFVDDLPYTDAYLTVEGAREVPYGTSSYDELIEAGKETVESIAEERCQARLDALTDQLYDHAATYGGLLDLMEYRLEHTKAEMDDPEPPTWLVMGRDKNAGMSSFVSDADRVDHIASIFPLIFFLVAALVALTTMTRMVDEERQVIGTHKALGYTRGRITWKYAAYVLAAGLTGAAVGIAVLTKVLPGVIMNAYAIMYYVPTSSLPVDWPIAIMSAGLAIGIVLLATWAACASTLREKPASLMLPRAPKSGKRILLERVSPLWSRLSFTWKVTCRNLFRYKKRLIMTIIGIAGCTALLLTGLGLHNAINDIIDIQYGEIIRHNALIVLEDKLDDSSRARVDKLLAESGAIESSTKAYTETMLASGPRASDKRIDLVVPENPDEFAEMKVVRTRERHDPVPIEGTTVLLNEKMAQELGVGVGDTITVSAQDAMGNPTQDTVEFTVGALYENYIYNYLYMTEEAYELATGKKPVMNAVYAKVTPDAEVRAQFDELIRNDGAVKTLTYNDEVVDTYRTMLRSVDLIVVVLVVSAAALAFIVLYNLTNINIEERIREIATLKVLGFTRRETNAYIFREIVLLAIIGAAIGLILGIYLESFVVITAEVDQVMFGRSIHPPSFVAAFVLTLVFSGMSMLLMLPKLAHVNMVESLKSNE
ncbi:MAG: FtsX-like permease family protein [Eggerthellaceae bacterium]|nr:FtsX-like permease family protein [Eggerthellaceae bacterium]